MSWAELLETVDRRDRLCALGVWCPSCRSKQVQLRDWLNAGEASDWKCRDCKHEFFLPC